MPDLYRPWMYDAAEEVAMDAKARRKALGWSRAELARRAGVDPAALALIERDAWSETDALTRVAAVLARAEAGDLDVQLPAPTIPDRDA